jgi:hypothetical protein
MTCAGEMRRSGKVAGAAKMSAAGMSNRTVAAAKRVATAPACVATAPACVATATACVAATAGMALRQCRSRARQNQS